MKQIIAETYRSISSYTRIITLASALPRINYKKGNFNKNRYYTIAGSGLIGLSVRIPILLVSRAKTYKLTDPKIKQGKHIWYLKSRSGNKSS
jgi:hypothetical protein